MINIKSLSVSSIEFKEDVLKLYVEALNYLKMQSWCSDVLDGWYDRGLADKLAVFYFKIVPCRGADDFVWIVVGDIPPAYVDIESASNGACALKVYSDIMEDWVKAVKDGRNLNDVFPVNVKANEKYASMLASRIKFIRENILVKYINELNEC